MKNKNWIIISIILATAILVFGYMNYDAKIKALEQKRQELADDKADKEAGELRMQMMYDNCISSAYDLYSSDWDGSCDMLDKPKDCILPLYLSDRHDEKRAEDEANCIKLYGKK